MKTLPEVFCAQAGQIIAADTQKTADHLLKKEGDNWVLTIPKQDAAGFEVTVIADESEITVYTEYGAHRHYTSDGNHPEVVKEAMGLVRDLLTEHMRVRVYEIRGMSYRFDLEWFRQGRWQREYTTSLFVLPWFGKKTEKIYTNRRLPPRNYD